MADTLSVDLIINENNAEVKISGINQKLEETASKATKASDKVESFDDSLKRLNADMAGSGAQAQVFGDKYSRAFSDVEARAEKTRKAFAAITQQRLGNGQFDLLTQQSIVADKKINDLITRLRSLKKESSDPANAEYFKQYQKSIRETEAELSKLERLQSKAAKGESSSVGGRASGLTRGKRGSNTEFTRAALEVVDDFVPAGANRPFNAVSKELLAISAISTGTLATFGAIAAVGYGIVKITQNIREEAERRLKVEEGIAIAANKQILGQEAALRNLQKMRAFAAEDRQFNKGLPTGALDELTRRKALYEKLLTLTPATIGGNPSENFERLKSQILALDAQIEQIPLNKQNAADDAFSQRWESWKKSQEDAIEAEKKAAEKFRQSVEQGKAKVKELEKTYNSVFSNLYQKTGSNNPFVAVFSEADKSLKDLRENLKGLSPELTAAAVAMQQKINSNNLFESRLNNNLEAFDLRQRVGELRNYEKPRLKIEDSNKFFSDFIEAGLKQISADTGGSFAKFARNGTFGGTTQYDARNEFLNVYERLESGGTISRKRNFNDLSEVEKQSYFDSSQKSTVNDSLNERLQKQLSIIYSGAFTDDQKAIADRRLVGLTSNLNPNDLTQQIREAAALANEREAVRRESTEREGLKLQQENLIVQKQINDNGKKLLAIAEKEGLQGIKNIVEIVDKTNGSIKVLGATPTQADVKRTYLDDYDNQ